QRCVGLGRRREVGKDSDGNVPASLVSEPYDGESAGPTGRKWPRRLKVFRDALVEAILVAGADFHIDNGPVVKAVDLEQVRKVFYKLYVVTSDDAIDAEQRQDSKRKAFARAVKDARDNNLIGAQSKTDGSQIIWIAIE